MPADELFVPLAPAPARCELPTRMPSPFSQAPPHPIVARAVSELLDALEVSKVPREGKMFGVLVAKAPNGVVGVLRGFSGMLDGQWRRPGFVPPLFDEDARQPWWGAAQAELAALDDDLRALRGDADGHRLVAALDELLATHAKERAELGAAHRDRRARRARARAALTATPPSPARDAELYGLDQESRRDGTQWRLLLAAQAAAAREPMAARDARAARLVELEQERARRSAGYQTRLFDEVLLPSASGTEVPLRALFAPSEPPSGAGECAGPKLLGYALRRGLSPVALAEVWWGLPPLGGGRHHGHLYPACRGKCGPILPHMLEGLDVEPAPVHGRTPQREANVRAADSQRLVLYEDAWLVAFDKPAGLLSVPGRSPLLEESVAARLAREHPGARLAHRLDLDTSGVVLAAKDHATYIALQRQFAERKIAKRYLAWLCGDVSRERGVIELALRTDIDDRPRQVVDPLHGKPAVTRFHVLARRDGCTLVELFPETGRTHQLRVHAAHPAGLDAPIVGDRLYGRRDAPRLLLHAASLTVVHPHTGERLTITSAAPFSCDSPG